MQSHAFELKLPTMPDEIPQPEPMTVSQFLLSAGLFEGGLLVVAILVGWLIGIAPTGELTWSLHDFGLGLLATIPMLLLLAAAWLSNSNGLQQIRKFLRDMLGPLLDKCRFIDIVFLALLAGVCEEVLFRGLLYQWGKAWNPTLAIVVVNVLFGLAHAVTPMYAWLAGLVGLYLTALMSADPTPNLLIPMTAHATYDLVAFQLVLWDYRRHQRATEDEAAEQ